MAVEHNSGAQESFASGGRRFIIRRRRLPHSPTRRSDQSYHKPTQGTAENATNILDKNSSILVLYFSLLRQRNLVRQHSNLRPPLHPKARIAAWKPTKPSKLTARQRELDSQAERHSSFHETGSLTSSPTQTLSVRLIETSNLLGNSAALIEQRLNRSHVPNSVSKSLQHDSAAMPKLSTTIHTVLPTTLEVPPPFESPSEAMNGRTSSTVQLQDGISLEKRTLAPILVANMDDPITGSIGKHKAANGWQSPDSVAFMTSGRKRSREEISSSVISETTVFNTATSRAKSSARLRSSSGISCNASSTSLPSVSNVRCHNDEWVAHGSTSETLKTDESNINSKSCPSELALEHDSTAIDVPELYVLHRFLSSIRQHQGHFQVQSGVLVNSSAPQQGILDRQALGTDKGSLQSQDSLHLLFSSSETKATESINQSSSVIIRHASSHDSPAPSPPTKRGGRSTGSRGRGGSTNGRGRGRGRGGISGGTGGRDRGDSPDPPIKHILTPEERATMSHIRARQLELKRFFTVVGGQQREILEALASRDLAKLMKKSKAHTKVPEYDELCADLDEKMQIAQDLAQTRLEIEKEHVEKAWSDEIRIIEEQFRSRIDEAKREHVKGAEGDLIIFKNAHRVANDDTGTEAGSDVGTYPRYHECPEPDTRVRGYSSTKITDEKSLKQQLASYDEQAQREVIDDDVVEPLNQSMVEQSATKLEEDNLQRHEMDNLAIVAEDELKKIESRSQPPAVYPSENPQFALSRLADASELVLRRQREQSYSFVPLTPAEIPHFPRDQVLNEVHIPPPPPPPPLVIPPIQQPIAPSSVVPIVKKPTPRRQKKAQTSSKQTSQRTDQTEVIISSGTSTLPAIAPAPARLPPPPPSPMHSLPRPPPLYPIAEYPMASYPPNMPPLPPPPAPLQSALSPRRPSQQFTFTPTQTPGQQYFSPTTPPQSFPSGPIAAPTQSKMHNTFVNQTVESRHQADIARQNAARTQGQGMGPRGGKRILLPKV